MSVTFPVREAMKDLLLANLVVPSEPDGDLTVYNSPDDDDPTLGPITLNKLPDWKAQKLVEDWQTAVANVILAQPTLNGTVEHIIQGDGGQFLYSRDGYYDWYTQDTSNATSYWGIGFRMQVEMDYSFAEIVGVS